MTGSVLSKRVGLGAVALIVSLGALFTVTDGGPSDDRREFWDVRGGGLTSAYEFGSIPELQDASALIVTGTVDSVRVGRAFAFTSDDGGVGEESGAQARTVLVDIAVEEVLDGTMPSDENGILRNVELVLPIAGQGSSGRAVFFLNEQAELARQSNAPEALIERGRGFYSLAHPVDGIQIEVEGRIVSALDLPAPGHSGETMSDASSLDELMERIRRRAAA